MTGVLRLDPEGEPEDLASLIESGYIWSGPQEWVDAGIEAIESGAVPMPSNLPAGIARRIEERATIEPHPGQEAPDEA